MTSAIFYGRNDGVQIGINHGPVRAEIYHGHTADDIDRICLQTLRCPESLAVKTRLKGAKDKLLRQSFEWILQDPQYRSWRDGSSVCLLWIKGGAGKGKTMMSIGLIEELSRERDPSTVVTYFFCQNADNELNTLESLIKGLIFMLIQQRVELKETLRRRWDNKNDRFSEDVTSWRALWNILVEMLDRCRSSTIYIVVDALDECQDSGMADFLKLIVRNGLDEPSRIKWLLTSRPLEAAERALLAGHDQLQAEGTFLWVSLVCKRLEDTRPDRVLVTIQDLPPGLHPFYDRILHQLNDGEADDARQHMRLLKAMMLAYRPLEMEEVPSVTGLTSQDDIIKVLVNRCASFLKINGGTIEFVHQSARDYLASDKALSILDSYDSFGHYDIETTRTSALVQDASRFLQRHYRTVTHWPLQLYSSALIFSPESSIVKRRNMDKIPEFIKKTPTTEIAWASLLQTLEGHSNWVHIVIFSPDGKQIASGSLDRTIKLWDTTTGDLQKTLEGHSNSVQTVVFSPDGKQIASGSLDKTIKLWDTTTGDLQKTLEGHSDWVRTVVFSPDGKQIASGSHDQTIKLWDTTTGDLQKTLEGHSDWDTTTGDLQKTLEGHSDWVRTVVFSPNGKQIASGSHDQTIKLWDTTTGDLQKTLEGHSDWDTTTGDLQKTLEGHSDSVQTVVFSPDGKQIASGSWDRTIKLWDTTTGDLQKTLEGHSDSVQTVVFSPDGKQIASGSLDKTIKLWDTTTGDLQKTLEGHSNGVQTVVFSPDGKQIASGSHDQTIKLWDTTTGDLQKTLEGHSNSVQTVVFSPDGKQIASGSRDRTIKLWDTTTGDLQKTLEGHSDWVQTVVFSPDGKQIASGSLDKTIKLWDTTTSDLQKTLEGHSDWVRTVVFSPDGKQIASGSHDQTIKLWDTTTGDLQKTLEGHSNWVRTVVFSPDGKQIASGSHDQTIKLWDTTTGDLQKTLEGHSDSVQTVVFSPDGKQIASGSDDKTSTKWKVTKFLKDSKDLGRRLTSRVKLGPHMKKKTSGLVGPIGAPTLSANPPMIDIDLIGLEDPATETDSRFDSHGLIIKDQWIYYGAISFLRLSPDTQPSCHAMHGDQVAIGSADGQVWQFAFDQRTLHSMLEPSLD
ncbi:G-protein beta WD- 40 repeats containing protein [Penicillium malachiteum]|uniref:G-protein beta WD- 40 repeats containing protein n=1 Tax=Penicillium malachiteum TaxID=1324776 RepID=A0AAD6N0Y6_9EURO|nr:G-protein beta WD- 40 repeats containing protein [Penicillium malachiteum]